MDPLIDSALDSDESIRKLELVEEQSHSIMNYAFREIIECLAGILRTDSGLSKI